MKKNKGNTTNFSYISLTDYYPDNAKTIKKHGRIENKVRNWLIKLCRNVWLASDEHRYRQEWEKYIRKGD